MNKIYKGNITVDEIVNKIINVKNIIMTSHINPDGDALGSILALYLMIQEYNKKNNKNIEIDLVIDDKLPKYMRKFEEKEFIKNVEQLDKNKKYDIFISLDSANEERYGNSVIFKKNSKESINIDHHISNTEHCQYNYVEDICSTAELLYKFVNKFDVTLTEKIAQYLYLGIINDTGNFRHDNVTENTFYVCSKLRKAGANNHKIANIIFEMSMKKINIYGDVYKNKIVDDKNKFIHYYLTEEKMKKYDVTKDDTDGIAEVMLKIEDTELSLFIRDEKDGIKGSFRANDKYDVNDMAQKLFNGGGHIKAAGFKTKDNYETIMEKVNEYLKNMTL